MKKPSDLFTEAMLSGNIKEVKRIIKTTKINPEDLDNWAICNASNNGYLNLVKYLATFDKVDPSADDNCAIILAFERGHSNVVDFLWNIDIVSSTLKYSRFKNSAKKIISLYAVNDKLNNF